MLKIGGLSFFIAISIFCYKTTMAEEIRGKLDAFKRDGDGKFVCLVCDKRLSSKQRVLQHLNLVHDYSPVKPVRKLYNIDSSIEMPRRTAMRKRSLMYNHQLEESKNDTAEPPLGDNFEETTVEMVHSEGVATSYVTDSNECATSLNALEQTAADANEYTSSLNAVEQEAVCSNEGAGALQTHKTFDTVLNKYSGSGSESDTKSLSESSESDSDYQNDSDSVDTDSECDYNADSATLHSEDMSSNNQRCLFGLGAYILRYNCSKASSESLINLMKALNVNSEVTKDLTYSKIFAEIGQSKYKSYHYCQICLNRFPDNADLFKCSTESCEGLRYLGDETRQLDAKRKPTAVFIVCDLAWQLKLLLERDGILNEILRIKSTAMQSFTSMSDIYQGKAYQNMYNDGNFLSNLYHISGILNTDGIPLYTSSKVKLWPVYVSINELSIRHRFSRGNTLLAGIWQGTSNPPFFQYLLTVAEELKLLYDNGVEVDTAEGIKVVKLCVCLATMDLQAKAYATSMTMHNGAFGCITCEEEGKSVKQGKGYSRCYPYRPSEKRPEIRDSDDIKFVKGPLATPVKKIKGISGPSGFMAMPWFDLVKGMTPDYMHSVLMGVCKNLLYLWVSPTQSGKPFFVGKSLSVVSQRLKHITPPSFIQRLPRDLEKHYGNLKATELQTWLLFYAYPCLEGILEEKYLNHFCSLSEGIYILLGDAITEEELVRAESLLDNFYKSYADLYGEGSSGLNVHNIGAHLVFYVRQWGPLFGWSCFGFEDNNAELLKSVHGTGDVTRQIISYKLTDLYIRARSRDMLANADPTWSDYLSKVCPNTLSSNQKNTDSKPSGFEVLKRFKSKLEQDYVIAKIGLTRVDDCKITNRILSKHGKIFYSEAYKRMKRRNCHTVLCKDGIILVIKYFVENVTTKEMYAVGHQCIMVEPVHPFPDVGHHMFRMKTEENIDVISVEMIIEEVFSFKTNSNFFYISRVPNLYGRAVFK